MTTHAAEHAKLSPSSSKTWFACPGSITLQASIPDTPKSASDEGTACHAVAAWCLTEHRRAAKRIGEMIPVNRRDEPARAVRFTEEMAELTQSYVDTVRGMAIGHTLYVEQRVDFSEFVGVPDQFGTLDAGIWFQKQGEIFVGDLKSGHTPVEVEGNTQLMIYALGFLKFLAEKHSAYDPFEWARNNDVQTIRLGIFQSKVAGNTEWTCTLDDLVAFAEIARQKAQTAAGAEKAFSVLPRDEWDRIYLHPDPNDRDCGFCRAMATCPAVARKVQETVGGAFSEVVDAEPEDFPETYTDADLSIKMKAAPLIEDWIKAVRAEVERRLIAGQDVPGFGLDTGRKGPRKFPTEKLTVVEELLRKTWRLKIEDCFNLELKSPTQLEKLTKPRIAVVDDKEEKLPPLIGTRRWRTLQEYVVQNDPKPTVKPLGEIKNPYTAKAPDAADFSTVDDDQLW